MTHLPHLIALIAAGLSAWSIWNSIRNALPMIVSINQQWREW